MISSSQSRQTSGVHCQLLRCERDRGYAAGEPKQVQIRRADRTVRAGRRYARGLGVSVEFGFISSTAGGDGDPLDLLILLDAPTFVGCLVRTRYRRNCGRTNRKGKTERNDRLVAVAVQSRRHEHVRELRELLKQLLAEVEHFFVSYNEIKGKKFKPLGRYGSARALALVRKGCKQAAWLKKPS